VNEGREERLYEVASAERKERMRKKGGGLQSNRIVTRKRGWITRAMQGGKEEDALNFEFPQKGPRLGGKRGQ